MRFAATMLTATILVCVSCSNAVRSAAPTTVGDPTVRIGSAAPNNTTDAAVECVHTDPAKGPISVHRALSCPDGTSVAVQGVITRSADGSTMLCDAGPGNVCLKIDGGQMVSGPDAGGRTVAYIGVMAKGVLSVGRSPLLETP